jgi:DNA-binding IclR family transcriptional regulator
MPPTGKPAERRLEAVERAMRVLDAFLDAPGEAGTNELARRTGINASTVSRLLATLVSGGYVEHVAETGRYRLGPHLVRLSNHMLAQIDLRTIARPHLTALEEATGETATLSIAGESEAVTVDFVPSRATVSSIARIGRPSVAHATATGKVMLAYAPTARFSADLEQFTDRTITSSKRLMREIARVREQGWAESVRERESDLNAVASPIFGAGGELAAILGVQGPAARFGRKRREATVAPLQSHAADISAALGYNQPDSK